VVAGVVASKLSDVTSALSSVTDVVDQAETAEGAGRQQVNKICQQRQKDEAVKAADLEKWSDEVHHNEEAKNAMQTKVSSLEKQIDGLYLEFDRMLAISREQSQAVAQRHGVQDETMHLLQDVVGLFSSNQSTSSLPKLGLPVVHQTRTKSAVQMALLQTFNADHPTTVSAMAMLEGQVGGLKKAMSIEQSKDTTVRQQVQQALARKDAEIKALESEYETALNQYEQLNINLMAAQAQRSIMEAMWQTQAQAESDVDDICMLSTKMAALKTFAAVKSEVSNIESILAKDPSSFPPPPTAAAPTVAPTVAPVVEAAAPEPAAKKAPASEDPLDAFGGDESTTAAPKVERAPAQRHFKAQLPKTGLTQQSTTKVKVHNRALKSKAAVKAKAESKKADKKVATTKHRAKKQDPADDDVDADSEAVQHDEKHDDAPSKEHAKAPAAKKESKKAEASEDEGDDAAAAPVPAAPAAPAPQAKKAAAKAKVTDDDSSDDSTDVPPPVHHKAPAKAKAAAEDDSSDDAGDAPAPVLKASHKKAAAVAADADGDDAPAAPPAPKPAAKKAAPAPAADDDDPLGDDATPSPPPPAPKKHKKPTPAPADDSMDAPADPTPATPAPVVATSEKKDGKKKHHHENDNDKFLDGIFDSAAGAMPTAYKAWSPDDKPAPAPAKPSPDADPLAQFDSDSTPSPPPPPAHKKHHHTTTVAPADDSDADTPAPTTTAAAPKAPEPAADAAADDDSPPPPRHHRHHTDDDTPAPSPPPPVETTPAPPVADLETAKSSSHSHKHGKHHHKSADDDFMDGIFDSASGALPATYQTWRPDGAGGAPAPAPVTTLQMAEDEPGFDMSAKSIAQFKKKRASQELANFGSSLLEVGSRTTRLRGRHAAANDGDQMLVAVSVLDEAAKTLQSEALSKLATRLRAEPLGTAIKMLSGLEAVMSRSHGLDPQNEQVLQWCQYLDQNMQAAPPVKAAKAKVREAAHSLSSSTDSVEALSRQLDSIAPLESKAERDTALSDEISKALASGRSSFQAKLALAKLQAGKAMKMLLDKQDDALLGGQARAALSEVNSMKANLEVVEASAEERFNELNDFVSVMIQKRSNVHNTLQAKSQELQAKKSASKDQVAAGTKKLQDAQGELSRQMSILASTQKHCEAVSAQLRVGEERKNLEVTAIRTALRTLQS